MMLRSGNLMNAIIPSLYFLFMGAALFFDVAAVRLFGEGRGIETVQWLFWFSGVPLGAMMVLQIAQIQTPPKPKYFLLLMLIPITFLPGYFLENQSFMYVTGLVTGALSLLAIWLKRDVMDGLYGQTRFGGERFWLIMALIVLNVAFLFFTLFFINEGIHSQSWLIIRSFLGIAFVYIAGTSLFRIYPQAFKKQNLALLPLNEQDKAILEKIKNLFEVEKIYQDASFGRAELARDLGVGEAALSRIVNQYYGKTIPQLLNEWRVKDAQRLLAETQVSVQSVFEESGFNSITTFNRVFKDIVGETPTDYRVKHRA